MSAPRPVVGPAKLWHFPTPNTFTLNNGIEVWAFNLPGQLVLSVDALLPAPLGAEPRAAEGVATLAVRLSDEGTKNHPGPAISAAMEDQAASFGGQARFGGTLAGIQVPQTRLEASLRLLTEVLATPLYESADLERHRQLRLTEIDQGLASPASAGAMAFDAAVQTPGSRLSRPVGGDAQTVAAITTADLHAFHDTYWRPVPTRMVVSGELPEDLRSVLNSTIGSWEATEGSASDPTPAAELVQPERHIWIVDMPQAAQTAIRVGRVASNRTDPDWPALQVAGAALGGVFGSRLNQVLREEKGYTYGAHAGFSPLSDRGVFTVATSCRNEVAPDAAALIVELLDLNAAPLKPADVAEAVNYLIGVAPMRYDTPSAINSQALAMAEAGLTVNWVNTLYAAEQATTADTANAAFTRWIDPAQLHMVLAGPAEQLLTPLAERGLDATVVTPYGIANAG